MAEPFAPLLTLLQLMRRARDAASLENLGFVMVNESLQLLPYRQAALWQEAGLGSPLARVAAVSGLPQPNATAPYTQWLERLFRTIPKLDGADGIREITAKDLPEALAAEWADWFPPHAVWLQLQYGDTRQGALLLATEQPLAQHEIAFAGELAHAYAHALALFAPRRRWFARIRSPKRLAGIAAGLLLIACLPVRLSVQAPAEVTPRDAFLVRAPLDGVVDRVLVKPNQIVQAGTPLFGLDVTALQARNAVARKAYDAAREEYRQSAQQAVTDDKSKLQMAQRRGELEEKTIDLDYSTEQLGRVQVKAERGGVAVFADANDWQGKTVVTGERVMTLADPARIELRIDLPVGNSIEVEPGAQVIFHPNADALSSYPAHVSLLAYQAEPARDGVLAYRITADFEKDTHPPRIGLMGTAKLSGARVPLIYHILRRPITGLRQWLGW